ncbi:hypothetical protein H5399_08130 [Tessaracoccus sp. MC1627]|uniref:hypothetical protein n=1 Tax=Tessaracoccus sp. MC1627 TaxID=2760312 RepID=UPI00160095DC|nr:hypothetical protein [Tessaracoccus sp. MC1627]MBB1512569.1 hypothetical protein [Tessaracoccus sp. MC1627]
MGMRDPGVWATARETALRNFFKRVGLAAIEPCSGDEKGSDLLRDCAPNFSKPLAEIVDQMRQWQLTIGDDELENHKFAGQSTRDPHRCITMQKVAVA